MKKRELREDVRPKLLPKLPRQQLKKKYEFKDNNRNFESPFFSHPPTPLSIINYLDFDHIFF